MFISKGSGPFANLLPIWDFSIQIFGTNYAWRVFLLVSSFLTHTFGNSDLQMNGFVHSRHVCVVGLVTLPFVPFSSKIKFDDLSFLNKTCHRFCEYSFFGVLVLVHDMSGLFVIINYVHDIFTCTQKVVIQFHPSLSFMVGYEWYETFGVSWKEIVSFLFRSLTVLIRLDFFS